MSQQRVDDSQHSLVLHVTLTGGDFGSGEEREEMSDLKQALEDAVVDDETGWCDGWETGVGEYSIFLYGPSGDALLESVLPVVESYRHYIGEGSRAVLRYGRPKRGTRERIIPLDGQPEEPDTRLCP